MQDLLKKIIEMDEQARKIEQQAKSEKEKSEAEVEQLREKIYTDYIERAKERVEKNIAIDKAHAEEKLTAYAEDTAKAKADMGALYEDNKDKWVSEIVGRVLA